MWFTKRAWVLMIATISAFAELQCLNLARLPQISEFDMDTHITANAAFVDDDTRLPDIQEMINRLDSQFPLIVVGPECDVLVAASILVGANISHIVALGLANAARAAAAAWLSTATYNLQHPGHHNSKPVVQVLVTDKTSKDQLHAWSVPIALSNHFTSYTEVAHVDALAGFLRVEDYPDADIGEHSVPIVYVPRSCLSDIRNENPLGFVANPFGEAAVYLVSEAHQIVARGDAFGTRQAVFNLLNKNLVEKIDPPVMPTSLHLSRLPTTEPTIDRASAFAQLTINTTIVIWNTTRSLAVICVLPVVKFLYYQVWKPMTYAQIAILFLVFAVIALALALMYQLKVQVYIPPANMSAPYTDPDDDIKNPKPQDEPAVF